jgi:hypothetical protein
MRLRPALVLAAPAGVLGGHAIGYMAAPGPAGSAAVHHGHLALVAAVAVPLAVLAVAWAATGGAGRLGSPARPLPARPLPIGPLLAAQWVLFTGQEVVEHAAAGHGPGVLLHSPALWCGLAAQVVTAVAVVVLLRASAATGARLLTLSGLRLAAALPPVPWRAAPGRSPRSLPALAACPSRGPPGARFA